MADGEHPDAYLAALVERSRGILGGNLVGAYAAGSVALDAYQPGRSDIDVALVTAEPLDDTEKHDLVAALRHEALPVPARGLELVVYTRASRRLRNDGSRVRGGAQHRPRDDVSRDIRPGRPPAADGRFWYALDRSILSSNGRALLGPPANEVFADVAPDDLRALLVEALELVAPAARRPGGRGARCVSVAGAGTATVSGCPRSLRRSGCWPRVPARRPSWRRRSPGASARAAASAERGAQAFQRLCAPRSAARDSVR